MTWCAAILTAQTTKMTTERASTTKKAFVSSVTHLWYRLEKLILFVLYKNNLFIISFGTDRYEKTIFENKKTLFCRRPRSVSRIRRREEAAAPRSGRGRRRPRLDPAEGGGHRTHIRRREEVVTALSIRRREEMATTLSIR
jgi:hypothetical protein